MLDDLFWLMMMMMMMMLMMIMMLVVVMMMLLLLLMMMMNMNTIKHSMDSHSKNIPAAMHRPKSANACGSWNGESNKSTSEGSVKHAWNHVVVVVVVVVNVVVVVVVVAVLVFLLFMAWSFMTSSENKLGSQRSDGYFGLWWTKKMIPNIMLEFS